MVRLEDLTKGKQVQGIQQIREEMERAEARRLQPHFIASFFLEAFTQLGGTLRQREPQCYQISHVPAVIRNRGQSDGDCLVVGKDCEMS
ncbi:hypothetical protein [Nostoc favosum]|uniref:Uncharacterized protein n=1 Tax=Nostoc favosum CHAB5714 TaxID=2780399 RepID=A0ABS8I1K8_9NOSO|nr:hypothetical protein [Nostoc favosum]MCC5597796.1 hypothetical protein [Nostoc favosum CHAB5714]